MKRQIDTIRYLVVIGLLLATVIVGLAVAAADTPDTSPPELPTLTPPPHDWHPTPTTQWIPSATPGPYPYPQPIVTVTPAPYPVTQPKTSHTGFMPFVERGD